MTGRGDGRGYLRPTGGRPPSPLIFSRMKEIGIDIETYSSVPLQTAGVYRYAEAPDFAVLLFAYSVDGGPVRCVDLAGGEELPAEILAALTDPAVTKTAFNATFERICLSRMLGLEKPLDPSQWRCTMVRAARMSLPLSLGQCGEVLGIEEGKMTEGRALIRYFSVPWRGKRHLPSDAPERWETFKAYCVRDVEVEQAVLARVRRLEVPAEEEELYVADQEINDRGVMIDRRLAENAVRIDEERCAALLEEARELTGLDNPNSAVQLKRWLKENTGARDIDSLAKGSMDDLRESLKYWPKALRVLDIRAELSKTSVKKYSAMLDCVCSDGRIHGLMQFCGAARTGRWAGRLVQVQNLPQNHLPDIGMARAIVRGGDLDELEMTYDNPSQVLSELIRTAFVARPGCTFHVCDFSAIEARVIAWLAGEKWVMDVFREGGDIYCSTASKMFGVTVEKHGRNSGLRQKGKVAVLALGYGGGVAALEAMGGKRLGLTEAEEREIVQLWRGSNRNIVRLWGVMERAAVAAIETGRDTPSARGIMFGYSEGMMTVRLPSGRMLCYPRAKVETEYDDGARGDHDSVTYEGLNQETRKWQRLRTYGGKLTENIVQATARDILGAVLLRARNLGMEIVFHIHDEIIVEAPPAVTLQAVEELFSTPPSWCADLPLKGAGYSTPYYLKD